MKDTLTNFSLAMLLLAGAAVAEESRQSTSLDGEVERGREMIREARVEIVRSELHLTKDEATQFWPIYETYRAEIDEIQDRYAAMIAEYIRRYDDADLTDEYADELIATYFGIKRELFAKQEKFLPKFRAVMPALKVARLFQL